MNEKSKWENGKPKIAIILGSRKDEPTVVASKLFHILKNAGIGYEYSIISSDRNPEELRTYCKSLDTEIIAVIAVAGLIPNLPIVTKSWAPHIPVISVPLTGDGYTPNDTLLAAASTPGERPIIVSGIGKNGLEKAGYLAVEIAGVKHAHIRKKYASLQEIKSAEIKTTHPRPKSKKGSETNGSARPHFS
ncbi:MAG: AIR carboxylase family protein [Candidatus Diapherotrites archaeon]|uniref:AIR carboxylase family protein n=1 Tax=Candidatus Iainarchaeum sp. TaxID=3101447 RepID=A0A8T4LEQ2_9ARCH|nr:AIR carboxylase family protein [Candidatus Diapherotrites archaeon]